MGKIKNKIKRLGQFILKGNDPDFMIIGAQKAGTTSLHYYLDQHPKLAGSFPKELHYYSKYINYPDHNLNWYKKHFTSLLKSDPLYFESSPNYIFHKEVAGLIKKNHPHIRLILLLRNPVHRAFSAWNMYLDYFNKGIAQKKLAHGRSPDEKNSMYEHLFAGRNSFPGFREAIDIELKFISEGNPQGPNFLRKGLYFEQIANYLRHFDRDQLLILSFDQLVKNPTLTCNSVLAFLGIDNTTKWAPGFKVKNKRDYDFPLDEQDLKFLTSFYEEPNKKLSTLLGGEKFW